MTSTALKIGTTDYTTPTDTDVVARRLFDAPRTLVWDLWTVPEHIQKWMLGPDGWTMPVCEVDLRPGGAWRFVYRQDAANREMTLQGKYVEVARPERVVNTETWGEGWPEALNTVTFDEANGQTTMTMVMRYASKDVRDKALGTGMTGGMDVSFDRLDRMVANAK